jgi:CheY-like chemotaxis protein
MAKILLFEDDPIQIELIKKNLEPIGHIVLVAKNGQEGIKAAHKARPDLILMDMIMPGMHGLEATIKLKEDPLTVDIPIMALTIMSSPKFVQECYRAGIIAYIKKPFDPRILLESVERIVGKPERKINRILMIAGASRLATMIEMRLLRQGYQVNTFAGGKSALDNLQQEKADLLFLDISLDDLRKSLVMKTVPVVLFAPQASKETLEQAAARWGTPYFIVSSAELGDVLGEIKKTLGS